MTPESRHLTTPPGSPFSALLDYDRVVALLLEAKDAGRMGQVGITLVELRKLLLETQTRRLQEAIRG